MAVNIEVELNAQLDAVNDKLAALADLQAQKAKLEATLKFLTGEITLADVKTKRIGKGGAPKGAMAEDHKLKIKVSNLKRRVAAEPANNELKAKLKDVEALLASLPK